MGSREIALAGRRIPRLSDPPLPIGQAQQHLFNEFVDLLMRPPAGSRMAHWRSAAAAHEAAAAPPVRGRDGEPARLGRLAIFRPGGSNVPPSPAFLFRMARYADRVVIAYCNPTDPEKNALRPLTELEGMPVPAGLRGRLFAVGDGQNRCILAYRPASDNFVEQLAEMHRRRDLLGLDPLTSGAVVVSHSNGTADAALTRERLEAAGLSDAIGKLVAISGVLSGVPRGCVALFKTTVVGLEAMGAARGAIDAMDQISIEEMARQFPPDKERLVDLSVAGVLGPEGEGVRPILRVAGGLCGVLDTLMSERWAALTERRVLARAWANHNAIDGLVPTATSSYGRRAFVLDAPHDHGGLIEDPAVVDFIARELAG